MKRSSSIIASLVTAAWGLVVTPSIAGEPASPGDDQAAHQGEHRELLESLQTAMNDALFATETEITANDAQAGVGFGQAIAISGDTLIVGAHRDDDGGDDAGAAYVFVRNGSGWEQQQKLVASDPGTSHLFGSAVAIDGDTAVVGAYLGRSAYVFVREGTVWTEQQKLIRSNPPTDLFGFSVALQGDTALIGGYSGVSAYVFTRSGTTWTEQQILTSSDQQPGQRFGYSVALDGDTLLVGAADDSDVASRAGAVYVFVHDGTTWSEQQKLTASDGAQDDEFGNSVALQGDEAVIGAPFTGGNFQGSAYFFTREGTVWTEQQKLNPADPTGGDMFGRRIALQGDTLLVSRQMDNNVGNNAGAAYVYTRTDGLWTEQQILVATDAADDDHFGFTVALDLPVAAIVALRGDDGVADSGSVYLYEMPQDSTPPIIESVVPSTAVILSTNHSLVPVAVAVVANDDSGGIVTGRIVSITSNEPADSPGSGNTSPDWEITGPLTATVRAERSGTGNGRIYTITVECQDEAGNPATATTEIAVPKSSK